MIPLAKPSIDNREVEAAAAVVRSGWLAQGPNVAALEDEFGKYLDSGDPPHVIACSGGTTALHIAAEALGVTPASRVAVPSFTFVASANAVLYTGASVKLLDCNLDTFNLNPRDLLGFDGEGLVVVHQMGRPCDMGAVEAFLDTAYPPPVVIEDAACAIGARYSDGTRVGAGRFSQASTFSLHGSKSIVAGEGGLITTRDPELATVMRSIRNHGVNSAVEGRKPGEAEKYLRLGFNYKMTDVEAAIARVQISKADEIVAGRRAGAAYYIDRLRDLPLDLPQDLPGAGMHAYQRFLVRVDSHQTREHVVNVLLDSGVSCRRSLQAIHRQPYIHSQRIDGDFNLPSTDEAMDCCIQIPLWAEITRAQQEVVIAALNQAFS